MPTTFEALIILLFLSVPAYISITFFKRNNPGYYFRNAQSSVEQIALYIFLGTVVNVLTLLSMSYYWGLLSIVKNLLPDILINNINIELGIFEKWFFVLILFLGYSFLGTIISILLSNTIYYFMPDNPPMFMKELNELKIAQKEDAENITWVLIHFRNGDRCLGLASEARWVGDKDNSIELSLDKTYYQAVNSPDRDEVGRFVLRSNDILWLGPYQQKL